MTTLATTLFSFFGAAPEDPKSLAQEVEALQVELRNLRRARYKAAADDKANIAAYREFIKSRLKALFANAKKNSAPNASAPERTKTNTSSTRHATNASDKTPDTGPTSSRLSGRTLRPPTTTDKGDTT